LILLYEALNQMALFVQVLIYRALLKAIGARRDHRLSTVGFDFFNQRGVVVAFVSQ